MIFCKGDAAIKADFANMHKNPIRTQTDADLTKLLQSICSRLKYVNAIKQTTHSASGSSARSPSTSQIVMPMAKPAGINTGNWVRSAANQCSISRSNLPASEENADSVVAVINRFRYCAIAYSPARSTPYSACLRATYITMTIICFALTHRSIGRMEIHIIIIAISPQDWMFLARRLIFA